MIQSGLLLCGFLGPLPQLVMDRLAGQKIAGFDFSARSISELGALGSPVRSTIVLVSVVGTVPISGHLAGGLSGALVVAILGLWHPASWTSWLVVGAIVLAGAEISNLAAALVIREKARSS